MPAEQRLCNRRVDARTAVSHPQPKLGTCHLAADADLGAIGRVLHGVGGKVQDGLLEASRVSQHRPRSGRRDAVECPGPRAEGANAVEQLRHQLARIDRAEGQEVGLLGLSEQPQVADVTVHAVELIGDDGDRLGPLSRIVAEHLEVPPGDRDRCAQLVRHVVEEPALGAEALIEPVDHVVERRSELGQLVVTLDGDAGRKVRVGDPPRRAGQVADRPHDPAGDGPCHRGRDRQDAESSQHDRPHEVVDLSLLVVGEVRDDEDPGRRAALGGRQQRHGQPTDLSDG